MISFDWKSVVKKIAPILGTALGGPAGGLATKIIAEQFLGKPDASEKEISSAVELATPEQLVRFKEIEAHFLIEQGKRVIEQQQLEVQDRERASVRQVDMAKYGHRDWMPEFLTVTMSLGFFILLFVVAFDSNGLVESTRDLFFMMIGALVSQLNSIKDYYFGSSSSSRAKDFLMGKK